MVIITHEDRKTRIVHVLDFKIHANGIREIFFTPDVSEAMDFKTKEDATKIFNELVAPSNVKALKIQDLA